MKVLGAPNVVVELTSLDGTTSFSTFNDRKDALQFRNSIMDLTWKVRIFSLKYKLIYYRPGKMGG